MNQLKSVLTVKDALGWVANQLSTVTNSQLESELILALVLNQDRFWIIANVKQKLNRRQLNKIAQLTARRAAGEPLAYLAGQKDFFGRSFAVTLDTLIPRPETEGLILQAKALLKDLAAPKIIDLGTGCGVIAITLLLELPTSTVKATDISPAALKIARRNGQQYEVTNRLELAEQDLLTGEVGHYDLLVANLPYVEEHWLRRSPQAKELAHEPDIALAGGITGTAIIERLLRHLAINPVAPLILLEHGDKQEPYLKKLARQLLPNAQVKLIQDLAGTNRLIKISL